MVLINTVVVSVVDTGAVCVILGCRAGVVHVSVWEESEAQGVGAQAAHTRVVADMACAAYRN